LTIVIPLDNQQVENPFEMDDPQIHSRLEYAADQGDRRSIHQTDPTPGVHLQSHDSVNNAFDSQF